ncbi:sialate O-acetylesterase [Dyadobacter sp. CY323]|uniref:sialate O-acetylesterase n=1 Tax=Dyadobacter sp. CY323 TaxID=2907302 RepID=UPI001F2D48A8|nr:sialate O-acetylesterase [Dyadobacter sp. CY323]MCE6987661.1 T9SS type A sorting domain-containing protein [Dyadobacter sp. CY323]
MTVKPLLQAAIFFLISVTASQAQRFYSVVFSKLPQDYQLYPRDAANEALVPVSGIVEAAGWKYMSILVSRNNTLQKYLKADLKYQSNGKATFAAETKIKAELANYSFKVFVCKDGDSVLVVDRKHVVSGDVYVLSGQSNSTGFFTERDTSQFCRTFGRITDNLNTATYNAADTLWSLSNMNAYHDNVGNMGFEIQKQLMEKSGIPNCLINAGFHWSSAYGHSIRTEGNPVDLNNGYGRMLYRVQKAGLANAVKAYIFRQGESEAYNEGGGWEGNFDKLKQNLKMDFPNIQKFYIFQIDIIYYPSPVGAVIRDYQRRLPDIYPDAESIATVGTTGFDGLHYSREGNQQGGFELSRMMLKDFYTLKDTSNIYSPSIKKVFYKTAEKKQLVLVFDEGQELQYPAAYTTPSNVTLQMKDFIYLDDAAGAVTSGKAEGNRVTLELSTPQNASRINYLPMYIAEGGPYYPFTGPFIKNKLGMRAFTFYNVPIAAGLATPTLTAAEQADKSIKLTWPAVAETSEFLLERKLSSENSYNAIARLSGQTLEYLDKSATGTKLMYRLKAVSKTSESADYGYAEIEAPVVLGVEQDEYLYAVYPNPATRNQPLTVKFKKQMRGSVSLLNSKGQSLISQNVNDNQVMMVVPDGSAGLHVIRIKDGDRELTKKIVIR